MSNPWITHVKQYATDNNISYKEALVLAKYSYHKPISGGGVISNKFNNILSRYGDYTVVNMTLLVQPVYGIIQRLINVISGNELKKRLKQMGIDQLLHASILFGVATPQGPMTILFERNAQLEMREQRVALTPNVKHYGFIPVNKPLKELINNFLNYIRQFDMRQRYDARDSNCQTMVRDFLIANQLMTPEINAFTNQPTEELMRGLPLTNQLITKIVSLGMTIDTLRGNGINMY